jgi:cellulose 1,4-beta-cellobiosidase
LRLAFTKEHAYGKNVGSRMYLMKDEKTYQHFDLIGNELAFDVDLSTVACGLNSALYFVAMPADGGMSTQPNNKAGAKYGTGYCDAQCARDLKFLGGSANMEGWKPSESDGSAGVGAKGACCAEIDVWESNSAAFALTPHACENNDYHICEDGVGAGCGGTYSEERYAGLCDANGCDYNPYRMGNPDFYGRGKTVDTTKKFTVVTQFTATDLTQFFIQNGQRIDIPTPKFDNLPNSSKITQELCDGLFNVFDEFDRYADVGGWPAMVDALSVPHVLVLSIWADHYANMLWLDGVWPRGGDESIPGVVRGDCPADSGVPSEVEDEHADAYVNWSNIRFGPIGSTTDFS